MTKQIKVKAIKCVRIQPLQSVKLHIKHVQKPEIKSIKLIRAPATQPSNGVGRNGKRRMV